MSKATSFAETILKASSISTCVFETCPEPADLCILRFQCVLVVLNFDCVCMQISKFLLHRPTLF